MIETLNDSMLASVKPIKVKKISVTTTVSRISKSNGVEIIRYKKEIEKVEADIPFEKWTLPPQPEGYIQYLPYDPF